MSVKRYECTGLTGETGGAMEETNDKFYSYVKSEDYESLLASHDEQKKRIERLELLSASLISSYGGCNGWNPDEIKEELEARFVNPDNNSLFLKFVKELKT